MYYSGNRYLTNDEMKVNAEFVYKYLIVKGWSINAIAGILGNMETESTINPAIWEGLDNTNTSRGFGLVQWTPSSKYTNWCISQNLEPDKMESNLERILYEVENNLQWGNDSLGNLPPYSFEAFTQSLESPYVLGMNFLRYYERPLVYTQPIRGEQADKWFLYLHGLKPKPKKKSKVFLFLSKKRRFFV